MAQRLTPLVSPTNFVSHHHLQAKDSRPRTTPRATGLFPRLSVMHYLSQSFSYDHSWVHVIIGMWHKYPNPHCSHVVTVDVIDRSVDPTTGAIRTERVLGCKQRSPAWIVKLFGGSEDAFVREVSFVDPSTQTMTISSVNLSLSQFATCHEKILYSPAPDGRTAFHQTAEIQARMMMWRLAADKFENWLAVRFEQNAQMGKVGFADVLRQLWEDAKDKSPVGTPA